VTDQGRLTPDQARAALEGVEAIPVHRGTVGIPVMPIEGVDRSGARISLGPPEVHDRLLVFIKEECDGCQEFIEAASSPTSFGLDPADELVFIVRHLDDHRNDARLDGALVIESERAWSDYRIAGPPFFTFLLAGGREVASEGVAWAISEVARAVGAAKSGEFAAGIVRLEPDDEPA
jgi:hypothetical protein